MIRLKINYLKYFKLNFHHDCDIITKAGIQELTLNWRRPSGDTVNFNRSVFRGVGTYRIEECVCIPEGIGFRRQPDNR